MTISTLPADVIVDGYKVTIKADGTVEVKGTATGDDEETKTVADAKSEAKFDTNTELEDNYGNKVVIPEGFKIASDSDDNVTGGVVIEDVTHTATAGSQFVWIPVGTVYTNEAKTEFKTITLGRYSFETDGTVSTYSGSFIEEDSTDTASLKNYGNTIAKDIYSDNGFIKKATDNGGYYIGRYEARTATQRSAKTDALTQITEKPGDYVYNYVTQLQAAERSRNMYTSEEFTSDLINSYAWDTAVLFLQEFDNRTEAVKGNTNYKEKYSRQIRLSSGLKNTGTNNLTETTNIDKICNIYDMADNCYEWSTETFSDSRYPCVNRGGVYFYSYYCTSYRYYFYTTDSDDYYSFRPVLYVK